MTKQDYLKLLVEDIHSTTIATIGADGHPQTRVIDMMLYSLSHKKLLELASDAGAIYRFDSTVLINREIFDAYLERFHEPARKITVEEVEDE